MNKKIHLILFVMFAFSYNLSAQTQAEMNQKANADYHKADAELNKVYKQLINTLEESERQLLIKAQKDWLKFRDSHCRFEVSEFEGGSIQPLMYSNCLTESTRNRIDDLKSSLKNRDK
jgi:uncharacterized protein YecT (DUF1311 family)